MISVPIEDFVATPDERVAAALNVLYERRKDIWTLSEIEDFATLGFAALLPHPIAIKALHRMATEDRYDIREIGSRVLGQARFGSESFIKRLIDSQRGTGGSQEE
jgi:hypothetical protein